METGDPALGHISHNKGVSGFYMKEGVHTGVEVERGLLGQWNNGEGGANARMRS